MSMDRRDFLKTVGTGAAALSLSLPACLRASSPDVKPTDGPARKPNIIFILADDLGYGDLGCYGQEKIKTPHLDRLAAEGLRFTQYYAGSTVCAPSRSCLMTGQHTGHTRIRGNARYPLQPEDVTVAQVLKQAGYTTALIGKWGLGEAGSSGVPTKQGFDSFFGYLNQQHAHNYYPEFLWRNAEKFPLGNEVEHPKPNNLGGVATKRVAYSHDLFVQETLEFIDRHAAGAANTDNAQPFFLYLALTIPHANNEAGKKGMEVPDLGRYRDKDWPEPQKGIAAMISRMDRDIGRIVARLKQRGIDRDTIVFFTSDNGPHREGGNDPDFFDSNGPLRGIKRDLYEGGIRVPAIVRWPGHIRAGSVSDQVGTFADFLPTAAALAGVAPPPPSKIDGVSLVPTLLGRKQDLSERFLYWEFHERGSKQAVRWRDWKAVRFYGGPPLELYNLATDVGEQHNVAAEHPEIVKKIEAYLETARTPSEHWPLRRRRPRRRR